MTVAARKAGGKKLPKGWRSRYVARVRAHGGYILAAEECGVSPKTAERHRARDPRFDAKVDLAREAYADSLARDLADQSIARGNPVGMIVRLKALRPMEYIERQVTMSLSATVEATPDEAKALLAQLAGNVTPATLRALREPLALPSAESAARPEGARP